jgi:hypothetical protein
MKNLLFCLEINSGSRDENQLEIGEFGFVPRGEG